MKHIRIARVIEDDEVDDERFHYDEEYDPYTQEVAVRGSNCMMLVDRDTGKEVWRGLQEDR